MCSVRLEVCQSLTTVVKGGSTLLGPVLSKEKILRTAFWFCHHPHLFPGISGLVCSWKRRWPFQGQFVRDLHLCTAVGAFLALLKRCCFFKMKKSCSSSQFTLQSLSALFAFVCGSSPSWQVLCSLICCSLLQAHNHFILRLVPLTPTAFCCPLSPLSFPLPSLPFLALGAASHNLCARYIDDYQSGAVRKSLRVSCAFHFPGMKICFNHPNLLLKKFKASQMKAAELLVCSCFAWAFCLSHC